jgi:2-methylaconitate cis-trans-isomerase PrpF
MRGGTSKAVFFQKKDLPEDESCWHKLFLRVMGSPDKKQIDGMGGTVSSTSKIAVVWPSRRPGIDIDYKFFQVHIDQAIVSEDINCGNISSAVGPFAVDEGLVFIEEPITIIKIFNVNTCKVIEEHVRINNGKAAIDGDLHIQGVPGNGAPIDVIFHDPIGTISKNAFPTGKRQEVIDVPEYGSFVVTLFDCVNPTVFVRAEDLGIKGIESIELNNDDKFLKKMQMIRAVASEKMGLASTWENAIKSNKTSPLIAYISEPQSYTDLDNVLIRDDDIDLCCRALNLGKIHRSYPMSLAIATAAAATIEGTIVQEVANSNGRKEIIRLGHASGCTLVDVQIQGGDVKSVTIQRTARRIMDGYVYI